MITPLVWHHHLTCVCCGWRVQNNEGPNKQWKPCPHILEAINSLTINFSTEILQSTLHITLYTHCMCTHAHMHAHMYVCTSVCMFIHMHASAHNHTSCDTHTSMCTRTHTHTHMHAYTGTWLNFSLVSTSPLDCFKNCFCLRNNIQCHKQNSPLITKHMKVTVATTQ